MRARAHVANDDVFASVRITEAPGNCCFALVACAALWLSGSNRRRFTHFASAASASCFAARLAGCAMRPPRVCLLLPAAWTTSDQGNR
jgi:hypothetical protein